jgi:hypothetical protein
MKEEYIIHGNKEQLEQLLEFSPHFYKHIPYCSVTVTKEQESSLLEKLTSLPDVSYHKAVKREALDDKL